MIALLHSPPMLLSTAKEKAEREAAKQQKQQDAIDEFKFKSTNSNPDEFSKEFFLKVHFSCPDNQTHGFQLSRSWYLLRSNRNLYHTNKRVGGVCI